MPPLQLLPCADNIFDTQKKRGIGIVKGKWNFTLKKKNNVGVTVYLLHSFKKWFVSVDEYY